MTLLLPRLEARELSVGFGARLVLERVTFTLGAGEIAVVEGPSGGGKSTFLRALATLQARSSGELLLDGHPESGFAPARYRALVAYVPQLPVMFAGTVADNVRLGLSSVEDAHIGAVTFVQRSDSALRLNVHAHSLFLDGVYVRASTGALDFHALGAPTFAEVEQVARWTHARIEKVLLAHGRTLDGIGDEPAELTHDQPVLASCIAASAGDVQLLGESAGQKTLKLVQPVRAVRQEARALAEYGGVNVHAEVAIGGRDRQRLEHVLRYMARPPLALDRLALRDDGQVVYRFKRAWRDGTHAVVLAPEDFIARLCALVPPPRFHLMRYLGVLAGHSSFRALHENRGQFSAVFIRARCPIDTGPSGCFSRVPVKESGGTRWDSARGFWHRS